jgi:transcriptional regulator with XRE-family HTH domain
MLFDQRLLQERKRQKMSQEDLAKKLGVHAPIIGRYERGEVKPSIEVAAKLAEALGVSLDYLTGLSDLRMDQNLIARMGELRALPAEDQEHIMRTLAALIREAKTRKTFG